MNDEPITPKFCSPLARERLPLQVTLLPLVAPGSQKIG